MAGEKRQDGASLWLALLGPVYGVQLLLDLVGFSWKIWKLAGFL